MDSLMTVKEVAQYLKLNYMTVYKLAQKGKIPASKVGGNWRFKKEIVDEWLATQSRTAEGVALVVDDDARVRDILCLPSVATPNAVSPCYLGVYTLTP